MKRMDENGWRRSRRALAGVLLALVALAGALPAWADPPARAGRVSVVDGDVRLLPDAESDWRAAGINWPLTVGSRLDSGRFAHAEVRIGPLAVRVGEDTELSFVRLDEERVVIDLDRGSIDLRVFSRDLVEQLEVDTPQARVLFGEPGRYRIDVAGRRDATLVTTRDGMAYVYGEFAAMAVPPGRRGELRGGRPDYTLGDPVSDRFDAWVLAQERREAAVASAYVSPEMTGYEALDRYGQWTTTAEFGAVWYPSVLPVGWAPYRFGEWVWFSAWGWTWVDHAPWGFAPSHYGRWVVLRGRWCWVPGAFVARPVFAPAVVRWKQAPQRWSPRAPAPPRDSWVPLGPQERFVPIYRATPQQVERINRPHERLLNEVVRNREAPSGPLREAAPVLRDAPAVREVAPGPLPSPLRPPQVGPPRPRDDETASRREERRENRELRKEERRADKVQRTEERRAEKEARTEERRSAQGEPPRPAAAAPPPWWQQNLQERRERREERRDERRSERGAEMRRPTPAAPLVAPVVPAAPAPALRGPEVAPRVVPLGPIPAGVAREVGEARREQREAARDGGHGPGSGDKRRPPKPHGPGGPGEGMTGGGRGEGR